MEKKVFESKYAIATYNEQTQVFTFKYLSETDNMLNVEWKELMQSLLELFEKLKPRYIIDDNTERLYAYQPEMQTWTLELFVDCWNRNKLKKYAQIAPKNIINQIATEQILELGNSEFEMKFDFKLVENRAEALEWINK